MSEPDATPLPPPPQPQPLMYAPHQPAPTAQPRHPQALAGAVLCICAGIAILISTYLPLFIAEVQRLGDTPFIFIITGWDFHANVAQATRSGAIAANGAPMMFGGIILLAAGVIGLRAARRWSGATLRRTVGVLVVAGAGFVASTAWTVGVQEVAWVDSFHPTGAAAGNPDFGFSLRVGVGFWLLVVSALVAIGAAVLTLLPRPERDPDGGVPGAWPATPSMGFPVAPFGAQPVAEQPVPDAPVTVQQPAPVEQPVEPPANPH